MSRCTIYTVTIPGSATLLECSRSVACNNVVFRVELNPNLLCGHVT